MELREVAGHLQKAGVEVEVLTTCVKDFTADWNQNYYAAGVAMVYDVPTRRFPVRKRDTATFDRINAQLMQGKHYPEGRGAVLTGDGEQSAAL